MENRCYCSVLHTRAESPSKRACLLPRRFFLRVRVFVRREKHVFIIISSVLCLSDGTWRPRAYTVFGEMTLSTCCADVVFTINIAYYYAQRCVCASGQTASSCAFLSLRLSFPVRHYCRYYYGHRWRRVCVPLETRAFLSPNFSQPNRGAADRPGRRPPALTADRRATFWWSYAIFRSRGLTNEKTASKKKKKSTRRYFTLYDRLHNVSMRRVTGPPVNILHNRTSN